MKRIYLQLLLLIVVGNCAVMAQSCSYAINNSCWFTEQASITSVSYNELGTMLAFQSTSSFCGNTSNRPVLNMGPGVVSINTTLTKNLANSGYPGHTRFLPGGGVFLGNHGNGEVGKYVSPTGTVTNLSEVLYANSASVDRDTVVYITSPSSNGNIYNLNFANLSNPLSPVFSTIPLSSSLGGGHFWDTKFNEALATAGNRIYYAWANAAPPSTNEPVIIKCVNFSGNVCPNWNDVVISAGGVSDIGIRPTDGLIFARTEYRDGQIAQPGGMVIFNSAGQLATGFNHTDLNLITCSNNQSRPLVRFDSDGNIFANMPLPGDATTHGIGIYKFDPKGNLDVDFLRNVSNSYAFAGVTKISYFDVNPTTGELAVAIPATSGGYFGRYYALQGGAHIQQNNEMWDTAFQSVGTGDGASTNGARGTSGYNGLHILYNNGKLKVQGETTTMQTGSCGVQDPKIVPPTPDPAAGLIDCAKTAFISAPVQGTPASIAIRVTINVTTVGTFSPITLTGSGFSLADPSFTISPTTTGVQNFIIPAKYDGSALSTVDIGVGQAGTCTADLSGLPNDTKKVEIEIWTPENCTFKQSGPSLK